MPITLRLDDGSMLAFVPEEPRESDAIHITMVRDVPRRRFRTCPICLDAHATHKEHVPPCHRTAAGTKEQLAHRPRR